MTDITIDVTKDYYQVLGLSSTATIDDAKAAYIQQAPKFHPDTSSQYHPDTKESKEKLSIKFKEISEAYKFLTQPQLKAKYDYLRKSEAYKNKFSIDYDKGSLPNSAYSSEVSPIFNTQRLHYVNTVKPASNSAAPKDKYKAESWRNLSLSEKKLRRSIPMATKPKPKVGAPQITVLQIIALPAFVFFATGMF
jgi:DnaJ-class molecular chaperone